MVVPKGAIKKKPLEEVKSGSPSPEPFQEPEGMTTIDLNRTDDYSKGEKVLTFFLYSVSEFGIF